MGEVTAWAPQDSRHRRKHPKGEEYPRLQCKGFPLESYKAAVPSRSRSAPLSLSGPGETLGESTGRLSGKCTL